MTPTRVLHFAMHIRFAVLAHVRIGSTGAAA